MNLRSTWLLGIVLLAMGAFVYFYEVRGAGGEKARLESLRVFQIGVDDIQSYEVKQGEKITSLVRLPGGKWKMTAPEAAEVNQTRVDSMAQWLAGVKASRVVTEKMDDPTIFELDRPKLEVSYTTKGGQKTVLYLGGENPIYLRGGDPQKGNYAKRSDGPEVYLIDAIFLTEFERLVKEPPYPLPTPTPEPTSTTP